MNFVARFTVPFVSFDLASLASKSRLNLGFSIKLPVVLIFKFVWKARYFMIL